MAEALLGIVPAISAKMLALAAEEISRAWGVNCKERPSKKLSEKVEMMEALISDAQKSLAEKAPVHSTRW